MLARAFPSQGLGASDLAKECAWPGVYIPGSAWVAKGTSHGWELSTGRSSSWAPLPSLHVWTSPDLPECSCGRGQEEESLQSLQGNSISVESEVPSAEPQ